MDKPLFSLRFRRFRNRPAVKNSRRPESIRRLSFSPLEERTMLNATAVLPEALVAAEVSEVAWDLYASSASPQRVLEPNVLFDPGTPQEVVDAYEREHTDSPLAVGEDAPAFESYTFSDGNRWTYSATSGSAPSQGQPITLTWSIVPDGTSIYGYGGEPTSPSNLRAVLNNTYGSTSVWLPLFQRTFDRWSDLTGVTFVYEPNDDGAAWTSSSIPGGALGVRGDVRIAGHTIDGPSGTLAYNFYPNWGDMVIDTADASAGRFLSSSLGLRNVLAHEVGHGLGIGHVNPVNRTKLMEPYATTAFDGPQFDDILAAHRGYGDRFEENGGNDVPARAANLGPLDLGQTIIVGADAANASVIPAETDFVSIDDDSDVDFFRFTVSSVAVVDLALTPRGPSYESNGAVFNSAAQSDLSLALFDADGTTMLASSSLAGLGVGEAIADFSLPSAGEYFVRIGGAHNAPQFYELSVAAEAAIPPAITGRVWEDVNANGARDAGEPGLDGQTVFLDTVTVNGVLDAGEPTATTGLGGVYSFSSLAPGTYTVVATLPTDWFATFPAVPHTHTVTLEADTFAADVDFGAWSGVMILDDGQSGFSTSGSWTYYTGVGLGNDVTYSAAGSGADVANWTFTGLGPGRYQVSATWSPHPNRATNAPYSIFDGASLLATVGVNQESSPNDFTDRGAAWEDLGTVSLTGSALTVRLSDAANEYVIADAVRIQRVGDLALAPDVQVLDGAADIPDGGSIAYGTTAPGVPVSKTFTVRNAGTQDLTLGAVSVPAGFTLVRGPDVAVLAPAASTSFVVQLDAAAEGEYRGTVSFATNDADENPFDFTVSGAVAAPPVVQILDDGQSGFSTSGSWTYYTGVGLGNDVTYSAAGSGADVARWTFTGLSPGQYQVAATWSPHPNRATNAPYLIYDGSSLLATVGVNQELSPNDFQHAGAAWETLATVSVTSSTLMVRLTDAANEYVIADAVRIERLGDLVFAPEVQVLEGGVDIPDGGAVSYGTTAPGAPVSKTFTVRNSGTQDLTLGAVSVPAGFTLVRDMDAAVLTPGASASFAVQLDAAAAGEFGGTVSFENNDSDENPFNFAVSGAVVAPPAVQILDDGQSGFNRTGSWTYYTGQGYGNDVTYSAAGSGADAASWTFTGLSPGQYQVAVTWSPHPNRATNAPYSILDGSSLLATVAVNQELSPSDFTIDGAAWKRLGTVSLAGSTLTVRLTDAANEYVIADAVRIERVADLASSRALQLAPQTTERAAPAGAAAVFDRVFEQHFPTGRLTAGDELAQTATRRAARHVPLDVRSSAVASVVQESIRNNQARGGFGFELLEELFATEQSRGVATGRERR